MLWPLEPAVHSRDVEQRLLQLELDIFRMEREMVSYPIGRTPTSNNFPLPPEPEDSCTTTCITGTPTIPLGGGFAFRRHSILSSGATGIVYLDWDGSAWTSPTIPLITPLVCAGFPVDLRWQMTATGIGIGQVTLVLQYDIGSGWTNGPTWVSTALWNPYCGLTFSGGTDFNPALLCNQSADTVVCVNPVDLCGGEHSEFFNPSRVFTFTPSGLSGTPFGGGSCSNFNNLFTLTWRFARSWYQTQTFSGRAYVAEIVPDSGGARKVRLIFRANGGDVAFYQCSECDFVIPGVNVFDFVSSSSCTGWPSTLDVTCT